MRWSAQVFNSAMVSIGLVLAGTGMALAQSTDSAEQQKIQQQLQQIEKKLEDKTATVEDLAEKEKKARAKARALEEEIEITAKVRTRLRQTYQKLGREYSATDQRVRELQERRLYRQEVQARTVRKLYISRPVAGSAGPLGTGTFAARRQVYAQKIGEALAAGINGLADSLSTGEQRRDELAQSRDQVRAAAAKKDKEKENKQRQLAKSDREAFGYRQQREQELEDIEQIQREAQILGELIDRLAELRQTQEAIDYDFPGWKGRLHWPITGEVKSTVGRKIEGKYQTETYETGMFISGAAGAAVVNAADGEVVFAGQRRGLGNVVIVAHGSDYFTVFAHLGDISVIIGQILRAGDPVGTAGERHPRFGAGVLFELRHNKEVLDPLEWLK